MKSVILHRKVVEKSVAKYQKVIRKRFYTIFWADIQINAFAYAVMHGLWRSATEKSGCAVLAQLHLSDGSGEGCCGKPVAVVATHLVLAFAEVVVVGCSI